MYPENERMCPEKGVILKGHDIIFQPSKNRCLPILLVTSLGGDENVTLPKIFGDLLSDRGGQEVTARFTWCLSMTFEGQQEIFLWLTGTNISNCHFLTILGIPTFFLAPWHIGISKFDEFFFFDKSSLMSFTQSP